MKLNRKSIISTFFSLVIVMVLSGVYDYFRPQYVECQQCVAYFPNIVHHETLVYTLTSNESCFTTPDRDWSLGGRGIATSQPIVVMRGFHLWYQDSDEHLSTAVINMFGPLNIGGLYPVYTNGRTSVRLRWQACLHDANSNNDWEFQVFFTTAAWLE